MVSSSHTIAKSIGADGVHYPKTYRHCRKDKKFLITCSCHGYNDFKRIKQLNSQIAFISSVFSTNSDTNKRGIGLLNISFLAKYLKTQYSVLGGVRESSIRLLRNRGVSSVSGLDMIFDITENKC